MKLYIVDAFTTTAFGGNPAGVVVIPQGQDFPEEDYMIKLATELKHSETAFVKSLDENTFHTRFFTPTEEVDLCGHATIATFWVLSQEGLCDTGRSYTNKVLAGDLDVFVEDDFILMDMAPPKDGGIIDKAEDLAAIYDSLGLKYPDHAADPAGKGKLPMLPQMISTGLLDIMVPLKDDAALHGIEADFDKIRQLSEKFDVVGYHAFCLSEDPEDKTVVARTRNFAPRVGINEEAATGTSSGALSYYLSQRGLVDGMPTFAFIQGEDMDRPSKIQCSYEEKDGKIAIRVGGAGVIISKGELLV